MYQVIKGVRGAIIYLELWHDEMRESLNPRYSRHKWDSDEVIQYFERDIFGFGGRSMVLSLLNFHRSGVGLLRKDRGASGVV